MVPPPGATPRPLSGKVPTVTKRKTYTHTTVSALSCARHELIVMARKLGLKSDGNTDVLAERVQSELKFHSYDYLKNDSVFKPAMNQGSRGSNLDPKTVAPPPSPLESLGPTPIMLRQIRSSMLEAVSVSKAITDAAPDLGETEVDKGDPISSQPMSSEELQLAVMELSRTQREMQKTLALHHKGISSCVSGMY